ncbi:AmmeMemoRadiSam system protein B [Candidatus Dependentiae bacterium]|nr:AmmeMemoRadiSam system protein B [Candidatus Dependentiae bacterium]
MKNICIPNKKSLLIIFILLIIFLSSCSTNSEPQTKNGQDRNPVFAGKFYPSNPIELSAKLSKLFNNAVKNSIGDSMELLAIVSPHAGYIFSGTVAASAFIQINGNKQYDNIFIISSSHTSSFNGASIYNAGNFITPLGKVKVNTELADQLISENDCFIKSVKPHLNDHTIEVQLPFLQYIMKKDYKIVPIMIGTESPETIAKISKSLKPFLNFSNLFIISTDMSHYPDYDSAVKTDKETISAILSNSSEKLLDIAYKFNNTPNLSTRLCGLSSVLTLINNTQEKKNLNFSNHIYKNSGDAEKYGDKSKVVGYCAISISADKTDKSFNIKNEDVIKNKSKNDLIEKQAKSENIFTENEKKKLLTLVKTTITEYLKTGKIPEVSKSDITPNMELQCGIFVTLNKSGNLRGCIGRFVSSEPLYKTIQEMAIASATQDYRFSPVTLRELDSIDVEISILSPLKQIKNISEIQLGKHGIYIKKGGNSGTFLPQVASETGWSLEEFLGHCSRDKAGIGWDGWKSADIYIYSAEIFH